MFKFAAATSFAFFVFILQFGNGSTAAIEETRIVGGFSASQGKFPYQVSLQAVRAGGFSHFCGGSIVNEVWVVTAAHCMAGMQPWSFKVVAGEHNMRVIDSTEQRRDVAQIITHEGYNRQTIRNDIALVRVSQPFAFNTYVRPISLDTYGPQTGSHCIVSGWGSTSRGSTPIMPEYLQYTSVPTIDTATCQQLWSNAVAIGQSQVCTGPIQGGRSACVGDSGGPLACNGRLSGIVSFGNVPCGSPNSPAVFTRVASFTGWIQRYTGRSLPLDRSENDVITTDSPLEVHA